MYKFEYSETAEYGESWAIKLITSTEQIGEIKDQIRISYERRLEM